MNFEQFSTFGIPMLILAAIGIAIWRIIVFLGRKIFGDERYDKPGLIEKWINDLAIRLRKHESEQTQLGFESKTKQNSMSSALQLLVESDSPPVGAAFIAAKAVHTTAKEIVKLKKSFFHATMICRIIATKFPEIEDEIKKHCDEIEKIITDQQV